MFAVGNLVFFKIVWAASLAGVVIGYAWAGLAMLVLFAGWHARTAPTARADFVLAGIAVIVGLTLDTLYVRAGLIAFEGNLLWNDAAPLWILALWANFALTMNGCLGWLRQRRALAAGLAFVFGPLGYYGGITLGTARVTGDAWVLYLAIGITWAVALPLLLFLASRLSETLHPELHSDLPAELDAEIA
ncbi:MAG: DUF2878 domain-containing protein [Gammaproteobacteria bacterium]|nr:DUF2878 domain-containing protein [Gammaproteobacteria bacterium]NND53916.1 DUF2878 domain-containing protein [Gammaproteobacteria bacterium]